MPMMIDEGCTTPPTVAHAEQQSAREGCLGRWKCRWHCEADVFMAAVTGVCEPFEIGSWGWGVR